ncbi:unnamed protein product [Lathyrus sativus]|nr:unnamed protein product [Lathyrus sativus]
MFQDDHCLCRGDGSSLQQIEHPESGIPSTSKLNESQQSRGLTVMVVDSSEEITVCVEGMVILCNRLNIRIETPKSGIPSNCLCRGMVILCNRLNIRIETPKSGIPSNSKLNESQQSRGLTGTVPALLAFPPIQSLTLKWREFLIPGSQSGCSICCK